MFRLLLIAAAIATPAAVSAQSSAASTNSSADNAASSSASAPATAGPSDAELIALGRKLTDWMYAGQTDSIYAHMSLEAVANKDQTTFENDRLRILARIGGETKVIEDKMTMRKGNRQYWRESMVEGDVGESIVLRWVFNQQGDVIGVGISPRSSAPPPE